uniref:Alternative protein BCAT1 n=1 Tax=Homo sapiens TaxID=9606 RepID=L8E7S9_HUMAN|nr:alternative protein BCAT1 [Homo sapiens]
MEMTNVLCQVLIAEINLFFFFLVENKEAYSDFYTLFLQVLFSLNGDLMSKWLGCRESYYG